MGFLVARLYCQQVGPSGNPVTHASPKGAVAIERYVSPLPGKSKKLATQLEAVQESREASH